MQFIPHYISYNSSLRVLYLQHQALLLTTTHYYSLPLTTAHYHSLPLTHYHSQLLTTTHYHSLPLTTTHYHSLPLTTTHYHSLPLTTTHHHSLPLTITHYHSLPLTTTHYYSLSLTTTHYRSLSLTTTRYYRYLLLLTIAHYRSLLLATTHYHSLLLTYHPATTLTHRTFSSKTTTSSRWDSSTRCFFSKVRRVAACRGHMMEGLSRLGIRGSAACTSTPGRRSWDSRRTSSARVSPWDERTITLALTHYHSCLTRSNPPAALL